MVILRPFMLTCTQGTLLLTMGIYLKQLLIRFTGNLRCLSPKRQLLLTLH